MKNINLIVAVIITLVGIGYAVSYAIDGMENEHNLIIGLLFVIYGQVYYNSINK